MQRHFSRCLLYYLFLYLRCLLSYFQWLKRYRLPKLWQTSLFLFSEQLQFIMWVSFNRCIIFATVAHAATLLYDRNDETRRRSELDNSIKPAKVIEPYLTKVRDRLKKDIEKFGEPQCYRDGSFWVLLPSPFFVMDNKLRFEPSDLYLTRVFVWLIHVSIKPSNHTLPYLGFPSNPIENELLMMMISFILYLTDISVKSTIVKHIP